MSIKEFYKNIGSDYQRVLETLMNDDIASMFVVKFLDDTTYEKLANAIKQHDIQSSFSCVHTLKGVTGNLGFYKLYDACCELTEQLRPLKEEADPKLFENITIQYQKVISELQKFIKE